LNTHPALKPLADALFPPVDWAKTNLANFIRNGFFAATDLAIKAVTGQTSNMGVVFKKPQV
jgi:hypothetical protein